MRYCLILMAVLQLVSPNANAQGLEVGAMRSTREHTAEGGCLLSWSSSNLSIEHAGFEYRSFYLETWSPKDNKPNTFDKFQHTDVTLSVKSTSTGKTLVSDSYRYTDQSSDSPHSVLKKHKIFVTGARDKTLEWNVGSGFSFVTVFAEWDGVLGRYVCAVRQQSK